MGWAMEKGWATGLAKATGVGEGGVGDGDGLCADAGLVIAGLSTSESAAASAADTTKRRVIFVIVSARTACRWDRCRHRPAA